ncbi:MAG: GNAT family N-acetyltransferase [Thermodesulfobacteriota bacterium]
MSDDLRKGSARAIESVTEALGEKPVFAYSKVHVSDYLGARALADLKFRIVETNVTLEKPLGRKRGQTGSGEARLAVPGDREAVAGVAGRSFLYSRFHADPLIPAGMANEIKARWAENFFLGKRGDSMIVAGVGSRITGFLQLLHSERELVIDLIAVDPEFRKRGTARNMITFAANRLDGFDRMRVGTQVANIPSVRLYESLGFRVANATYVFHFHNL